MTLAYYGQPVKMCHILPPLRSLPVLVEKKKLKKKKSQTTHNHVIFLFTLFIKLLKTHNRMSL
ncbi:hypothetical protein H828_YJM1478N00060 [Saccharomyces cerevisiae YJM1478]|nr:hypothetical protein H749_YJM195N00058 [Saccharomyces cerevisiae YJM195]AJT04865.1 hypothetical protein H756_YJM428N00058 [Saccharomyces cerevisiae YJM428]AJT17264.1 hypothetical protein H788_YJM1248N00057 [Saccharomyces cerevisiae YJM1248]AJT28753.1 hypothetical protein H820_YJM1439N00059 [Saccharomyces cerevisiae YJM1439]AJT31665.1 hypothetical protein H828_YJM1478N00060 [Saccharomyces cerevisiae YJM1478]CAI4729293.1 AKH_1a_G0043380.mRNA.1.CDS.1 [Saccharomyces cerevisiae]